MEGIEVRAEVLPEGAWEAWCRLSAEQQALLSARLRGESCRKIGDRQGCSKQAIADRESRALRKLGATVRCVEVVYSTRADETGGIPERHGLMPERGPQRQLDALADDFLDGREIDEGLALRLERALFRG